MSGFRPFALFALGFCLVYGLFLLSWPTLKNGYRQYYCGLARIFLSCDGFELDFSPRPGPRDTRITIALPKLMSADNSGPVRNVDVNSRDLGYLPTAMMIALIVATPTSVGRKIRILILGVIFIHIYILFSLAISLWAESIYLLPGGYNKFVMQIADGLEYTLSNQLGFIFIVPVLIWIMISFRKSDLALFFRSITSEIP